LRSERLEATEPIHTPQPTSGLDHVAFHGLPSDTMHSTRSLPLSKVVHVIAPAAFGGAESVVLHLCEVLRHEGVDVAVAALGVGDTAHPWLELLREQDIPVLRGPAGMRGKLTEHRWLRGVLQERNANVVHTHGYRADLTGLRAGRGPWRWVTTVHGYTAANRRVRMFEAINRWTLHRVDATICVSDKLARELRLTNSRANLLVVRNAPRALSPVPRDDARHALGLPATRPVVGWVGRFSHEKGPDRLAEVAEALPTNAVLALVGDGAMRETVQAQLTAAGIDCRWNPARFDIAQLMAAFDLLLLTSRTEGMPMVVLESMAAGTPVVSFDVGDVRQVIDETNGWVVPAEDLAAFVKTLEEALGDADERRLRGENAARSIRERYGARDWARRHVAVYSGAPVSG
jgi:glycosyltransferase involved in cell wall biosynthesis